MALFRTLLAALISLGLAFAPVAAAASAKLPAYAPMAIAPAAMDDDCPHHKAAAKFAAVPSEMPCPSGDMGGCDAAFCALKCFKVVAVFPAPAMQRPVYAPPAESSLPEALVSVSWRPSTPPPRS